MKDPITGKQWIDPKTLEENDYCSLHGHSTFSVGDAIGKPEDIVSSAIENGMDAIAITDHGNCNVVGDFYLHKKKLEDQGVKFKAIFGNEFYYHPSFALWERDMVDKQDAKKVKKGKGVADTENIAALSAESENEIESKKYTKDPVKRRHHLVILAQNQKGLENLFALTSRSATEGFYYRPRIDYNMLKDHTEGLVCTSACLAGIMSWTMQKGWVEGWDEEKILREMENHVDQFDQLFNQGDTARFFLEIQFNKVSDGERMKQHELNALLVKLHRKTGIPLIAAVDYHYPRKNLWQAREVIKVTSQKSDIHEDEDELDCLLYPKNAQQMIEAFNEMDGGWYITEEELLTAIKNTRMVADNMIENIDIDVSPRFPKIGGTNPYNELQQIIISKLSAFFDQKGWVKGDDRRKVYVDRVQEELALIKEKRFALYFLTYHKIVDAAREEMILSVGRGSGAGCLVNFLLGITELDPIRFGLMFARFLDPFRVDVLPRMDVF